MSSGDNVLFLLNSSPSIWRAMDELNLQLCQALLDNGVQPVVALANPVPDEIRARWESIGVPVRVLTYRHRWRFFWGLRSMIKEFSVETVFIRFYRYHQLVSWLVRINGVRRILFTDAESGTSTATGLRRLLKRLRTRITTAPIVRMIAISDFVKQRLIEAGVRDQKICVIYNGVDLSRFTPCSQGRARLADRYHIGSDEVILTTIARLTRVKCVDVLLKACEILKSRGVKLRFFIAGQGGPLEQELRTLSDDLGLSECVEWVGQTAEPELYLQGSDVFLLATEGEGFGNVLVEALACGTPVVGSRSGAIPEIVKDGECGFLAEPKNAQSFADYIQQIADTLQLRKQYGEAATERATHFSLGRSVHGTLKLYDEISG